MEEVGPSYQEQLTGVCPRARHQRFHSTRVLRQAELAMQMLLDLHTGVPNLESPVLFNSALRVLRAELQGRISFAEIGPHPATQGSSTADSA